MKDLKKKTLLQLGWLEQKRTRRQLNHLYIGIILLSKHKHAVMVLFKVLILLGHSITKLFLMNPDHSKNANTNLSKPSLTLYGFVY